MSLEPFLVLVGQVAAHVVTQADHAGAIAAVGLDVGQLIVGVVAVVMVARGGAADVDPGQIVQRVVGIAGMAEHRRDRVPEPVQAVVGQGAVAAMLRAAVADRGDVAVGVVVVGVAQRGGVGAGATDRVAERISPPFGGLVTYSCGS